MWVDCMLETGWMGRACENRLERGLASLEASITLFITLSPAREQPIRLHLTGPVSCLREGPQGCVYVPGLQDILVIAEPHGAPRHIRSPRVTSFNNPLCHQCGRVRDHSLTPRVRPPSWFQSCGYFCTCLWLRMDFRQGLSSAGHVPRPGARQPPHLPLLDVH